MEEFLTRVGHELLGRWDGPFAFRFFLQPTMASILAIRAGLRDARDGRPPYGWAILTDADHRADFFKSGWKDIGKLFTLAVIIDVIYEIVVFKSLRVGQPLIVGALIALPPYLLLRGPVNRIARWWKSRGAGPGAMKPTINGVPTKP